MREIKFRAWFKAKQEMISWKQLSLEFKDGFTTIWIPKNKSIEDAYDLDDIELMQYTGLKDKNGKEIYEGDIVCDRWANFYTPIFRNGIYMAYNVKDLHLTKQEPSTQFNVIWKNGCEVIGNIHDNPELLGESHED